MRDYCDIDVKKELDQGPGGLWTRPPARRNDCRYKDDSEDWLQGEERYGDLAVVDLLSLAPAGRVFDSRGATAVSADLREIFAGLVRDWKDETWLFSSVKRRIAHPAYLRIIGLGPLAVPLILEELRRDPDYWSYALEAITREDPVPQATSLRELRDAWLAWGEAHGY